MKIMNNGLAGLLWLLAIVTTADADKINVPGDFNTIQEAIDVAQNGDEVVVAPGTYFETINFLGKAIWLHSSDGLEVTTIDAQQAGTVVTCNSGEGPETVLEGFTITGGNAIPGGGMSNMFSSSPTVNDCKFISNTAVEGGGMFNAFDSSPMITNCAFIGNTADEGGGMFNVLGFPIVTDCTFNANSAGEGGGMWNLASSATLTNCTFSNNSAEGFGGGIYDGFGSPMVTSCTFSENYATQGGGIYEDGGNIDFTSCTFVSNSANKGGGMYANNSTSLLTDCSFTLNVAGQGGGIQIPEGTGPTVIGCSFSLNSATSIGGAVYNFMSSPTFTSCVFSENSANSGGGAMYNTYSSPLITDCVFTTNIAQSGSGGAISSSLFSSPTLTGCTISGNTAGSRGGGMYNLQSSPTLTACTFVGNSSERGGGLHNNLDSNALVTNCEFYGNFASAIGGAIVNRYRGDGTFSNCTIANNSAPSGGAMYNGGNVSSHPTLTNCIVYFNQGDQIFDFGASSATVTSSNVQGGFAGDGNIDADPLFVDPDNDDYHIAPGSPCIDAGDSSAVPMDIDTDYDGNLRFVHDLKTKNSGIGDCPIVDMGSYEFQEGVLDCCPWDISESGTVDTIDLFVLLKQWGTDGTADFDENGVVGTSDLLILLANWGPCE